MLHSDHFKPNAYLKLIKKYVFSEGEQFPLTRDSSYVGIEVYSVFVDTDD